jgi:hypothetical protein
MPADVRKYWRHRKVAKTKAELMTYVKWQRGALLALAASHCHIFITSNARHTTVCHFGCIAGMSYDAAIL